MTNLFYSQVEGVPDSRTIFFNYPILITYLFIYYSDVRFFLLSYMFYLYLFIYLFILFIYLLFLFIHLLIFVFIYLFIYLFRYSLVYVTICFALITTC